MIEVRGPLARTAPEETDALAGRSRARRVALYGRVSTLEQDVEVQLRELRDYAERCHWTVVGEYVDRGVSGAADSRPALNRLMDHARRRDFDILLVWKFDRFARSTRHLILALEEFRHLEVEFVSLTERIDTGSPLGHVMFVVLGALAQFERDLTRERVHAGLRKARADGKRLGRPPAIVNRARIAELQRQGLSFRQIGRRLGLPRSTAYKYRDPQVSPASDTQRPISREVTSAEPTSSRAPEPVTTTGADGSPGAPSTPASEAPRV